MIVKSSYEAESVDIFSISCIDLHTYMDMTKRFSLKKI